MNNCSYDRLWCINKRSDKNALLHLLCLSPCDNSKTVESIFMIFNNVLGRTISLKSLDFKIWCKIEDEQRTLYAKTYMSFYMHFERNSIIRPKYFRGTINIKMNYVFYIQYTVFRLSR
jgi:hypothetical protein